MLSDSYIARLNFIHTDHTALAYRSVESPFTKPSSYAPGKYTRYLPAVVYGSYTMAVVTPQFAQLHGRQWFTLYILQAVPFIFTLVIVQ